VKLRRGLILALLAVAACGGEAAVTTTAATPTTAAVTTTTGAAVTTTTTATTTTLAPDDKPDDRVDGLALAGGFQGGQTPTEVPDTPTGTGYSGYQEVTDETGILTVTVPVEWADLYGGAWTDNVFGIDGGDEGIGVALSVSPDIDGWIETWTVPGLFFGATGLLTGSVDELLDVYGYLADECTYDGRYEYDDGAYVGALDWWDDCGGVGTAYAVIVARPPGEEFTVVVEITMVTEADLDAADQIISSYYVVEITEGAGGALDTEAEPNYGATEVVGGFEPDPQGLAVEAGGDIDVSAYLGGDCAGFVTAAPDVEITYTGSPGGLLRFYFLADEEGADTVLVINDPTGEWWCSDDSFDTFNPTIDFLPAADGVYDIWVGTYSSGELIPGTLAITELDVNHP
jgi:hypothetical protein